MPITSEPTVSQNSDSTDETTPQSISSSAIGKSDGFSAIERQFERLKATVPARFAEKADQVLLGLSHTGQSIPMLLKQTFNKIDGNPNDVIGRISRTVLEQAQSVRQTLATKGAQLSEIADGVSTRVKSVNPFTADETSSVPVKPHLKNALKAKPAKSPKPAAKAKTKVQAKPVAKVGAKAVAKPKAKRAKASSQTPKE
jgi:hypothetical protein